VAERLEGNRQTVTADADPGEPLEYVALGDSISIDDYAGGPGRGAASLLARNRDDDFPTWRGHDLGGRPWRLLATDGATTASLLEHQLPELARLGASPALVTMTIGGNDVLSCYGDTRAALEVVSLVKRRVAQALLGARRHLQPSGALVLGTVYDPSDGSADAASVGLPPWPQVVEVLAALNAALREVASEHGAAVAEIHARFLGHGLARGDVGQPEPRPADRELWYCQVIEPNAWGAGAVRAAFWEALGRAAPEPPSAGS
jgi:lysophospholipase L1-like esterase